MKVGFIGAGNMASAMIGGIINSKLLSPSNIIASAKTDKTLANIKDCLLYTSPSPRDRQKSRMPSSA